MNRCRLLILLFIILSKISFSQDFVVLKKNSKVIQTWFKGQPINFQLKNQMWVTALIYKIQDDSLYLQPYATPTVLNAFGMPVTDTVYYGLMHVSVHSIKAFPKTSKSFSYIKNGLIFQLGGGAYFLLNLINTLSNNDPYFSGKNLPNVIGSASVFLFGCILHNLHQSDYIIGKKYHLEYVSSK